MNNQIRYHGLDALRALAMILGVVLHASMFYLEVEEVGMVEIMGYEAKNKEQVLTSESINLIFTFIHAWRMPVFFLLAGFFARLMIQKRGVSNLLKNRTVRIVIPFLSGSIVYNLILFETGTLAETHHLWFLYDLLWMYILLVLIKLLRKPFHGTITRQFDRFFQSPFTLLWVLVLLLPVTVIGRPVFTNWINPNVGIPGPFFGLGFSYFLIGWFMHRNANIIILLAHKWKLYLTLGLITFTLYYLLLLFLGRAGEDTLEQGLAYLFALLVSPFPTFLIILGLIGFTQAIFQTGNILVSYFVDASYWIYLMHLFVVFAIAKIIIEKTTLDPVLGVSINIVITSVICLITYHIFVRYTPIGWILHGKKGELRDLIRSLYGA